MDSNEYLVRQARLGHQGYQPSIVSKPIVDAGGDVAVNYFGDRIQISLLPSLEAEAVKEEEAPSLTLTALLYGFPAAYNFTQYRITVDSTGKNIAPGLYDVVVMANGASVFDDRVRIGSTIESIDFAADQADVAKEKIDIEMTVSQFGVQIVSASAAITASDWNGTYRVNDLTTFLASVTQGGTFSAYDSTGPTTYNAIWTPEGVAGARLGTGGDICAFSFDPSGRVVRADFQGFFGLGLPRYLIR